VSGRGIRAVVLDIGGVLEHTPATGHREAWERFLGLPPGELDRRLADVWADGGLGRITEEGVIGAVRERLGLTGGQARTFMTGFWDEYLGALNTELAVVVHTDTERTIRQVERLLAG